MLFLGGYDGSNELDTIMEFNPVDEEWTQVGTMQEKRGWHGLTIVAWEDFAPWCE